MNNILRKYKSWFIVIIFILVAISIRLKFHFSGNYLLAGVDGPYYPLQVKSIMEHFRLGFSDMPLLFMLEAVIANFLQFLHVGTPNECILIAVKFVDVLLPPLAAIPVFLFAKELNIRKGKINYLSYLMVAYSILNVTTILLFSNNFQKNAVSVVLVFFYIYFVLRILKYSQNKDILYAVLILIICTLTHFGSASIILLISGAIFLIYVIDNRKLINSISVKKTFIFIIPVILFISTLFFFDFDRLKRLVYLPVKLFESPVILMILDGQNIGEYFNPSNFIFPNLLGLFALVLFIRIRKTMEKEVRIIGYGLLISTFILASPLIGIDWANRLYMMSYIPIVGVYLILFSRITKKWILAFPVVIFCSIMCFVIFEGFTSPMLQSITDEAYQEFKEIKSDVNLTENTAIVARQDLKVLASWEFGTKGIANYLLTENDFLSFESVYYLIQKKGINYTREETWRKLKIPANSLIVFKGDYFDLYKVENIDGSTPVIIGRSKAKGVIISLDSDGFILQNGITGEKKTVIISDNTQLYFSTDQNELKNGMEVEIWGEGIPFSLNLKAQTIVELK
jgi:hypothetical protein